MFRHLITAALIVGTSLAHAADTALPEPISRMLQAAEIPPEAVGIVVLRNGLPLISHNAQQSMQPASTMKLFTAMTALEQLGPVFRGRTELRSDGEVLKGT